MTEEQWQTGTDPAPMLEFLQSSARADERKLRLFCCAVSRRVWSWIVAEGLEQAVAVSERYADALASAEDLALASWQAEQTAEVLSDHCPAGYLAEPPSVLVREYGKRAYAVAAVQAATEPTCDVAAALEAARASQEVMVLEADESCRSEEQHGQCDLLRCLWGNPFRLAIANRAWRTPVVLQLAEAADEAYRWEDLPILADALEEAGCTDVQMLNHLRAPGPHGRGCHVVDTLLGKEGSA
jgi:hypothetical protein